MVNDVCKEGRGIVEVHPGQAANIRRIFHLIAYENLTLDGVTERINAEGRTFRKSLPKFPRSSIHNILGDRAYIGELEFRGAGLPDARFSSRVASSTRRTSAARNAVDATARPALSNAIAEFNSSMYAAQTANTQALNKEANNFQLGLKAERDTQQSQLNQIFSDVGSLLSNLDSGGSAAR